MSWITGCYGCLQNDKKELLNKLCADYIHKVSTEKFILFTGGNHSTGHFSQNQNKIICGFVIGNSKGSLIQLTGEKLFEAFNSENHKSLQGHFISVNWDESGVRFSNDTFGLRTIYFYRDNESTFFSTKLSILTSIMQSAELDLDEFGSRWFTYNQWSHNSFIKGVKKLPPNSTAFLRDNNLSVDGKNWKPEIIPNQPENFFLTLNDLLKIKLDNNSKLTLGLSGGLDSRFMLSVMLKEGMDFNLHTVGDNDDPDVQTAKKIAESVGINLNHINNNESQNADSFLWDYKNYASNTELIEPLSTYTKLKCFNSDYFTDKVLIDGTMAEFARKQFLKKFRLRGFSLIRQSRWQKLIDLVKVRRPNIFKKEFTDKMLSGISGQLKQMFADLEAEDKNFYSLPDIMIANYRLPNYFMPEQTRLDNFLLSFMPFAQPEMVSASLSLQDKYRTNSSLMYKTILDNEKLLAKIPLIKGNSPYPFGSSTIKIYLLNKLRKKKDENKIRLFKFYDLLEAFIRDQFSSQEIKNYELYDHNFINNLVKDYYSGNKALVYDLNWLVTFELFRQGLNLR